MNGQLTVQERRAAVVEWLNSDRIVAQVKRALPDHLPIDWFVRCAQTALLNNPDLADADKASLLRELVAVAQLGLVLDPQLGEAWLIIDRHKKVQRRVGYQGLRKLVLQSELVGQPSAQAVYEFDICEIELGDDAHVSHRIDPSVADRGRLLGCYARAKILATNETQVEWMSWNQIEEHRNRYSDAYRHSDPKKRGPWGDPLSEVEMGRKTVLRRLCKGLPKSPQVAGALANEDRVDMVNVTPQPDALPAPEPKPDPTFINAFDADGDQFHLQPGEVDDWAHAACDGATPDELDALVANNADARVSQAIDAWISEHRASTQSASEAPSGDDNPAPQEDAAHKASAKQAPASAQQGGNPSPSAEKPDASKDSRRQQQARPSRQQQQQRHPQKPSGQPSMLDDNPPTEAEVTALIASIQDCNNRADLDGVWEMNKDLRSRMNPDQRDEVVEAWDAKVREVSG